MIFIVAGGPRNLIPNLSRISKEIPNAVWIGVDAGTNVLLEYQIKPDYAFGDFDSVSAAEMSLIEKKTNHVMRFQAEKDATDLEIALKWAIEHLKDDIIVYGATGGRIDHEFSNLMVVSKFSELRKVQIIDICNEINFLTPGEHTFRKGRFDYISFLALTEKIEKVTQCGFKYNLVNRDIDRSESIGVSNEIVDEVGHISFEKGICLVVRSKD